MGTIGEQYRPLREVVAEAIRGMIVRGELAAGERLLEDRLAEQLGVSRNPVREAIRSLEATGLVEVLPRRGAYVSKIDVDDARKLLEVRGILEGFAAEVAAASGDEELVRTLDRIIDEGRRASKQGNNVRAAELHRDFHLAIEHVVGNHYLEQVTQPLRQRTEMVFSLLVDARGGLSWDEHDRIRDAIAAGDGEAARLAVHTHLGAVIESVQAAAETATTAG
jgi:DNA-binding GntR family transcriptional regulator